MTSSPVLAWSDSCDRRALLACTFVAELDQLARGDAADAHRAPMLIKVSRMSLIVLITRRADAW